MKAQHKILACLFSLLLLGSCTSDWLEPEQPSKLDPNNAYSTYTGCMGLVTKLCKDLRAEVMGRNTNIKWAYENSDLAVLVNGSPRDLDGMMVPSIGSKPKDLWDNTYKSITRAAMLVTRSESLKGSQEQKDEIRAYGEFFLGYWYFRLITTYGDVPLITEARLPDLDPAAYHQPDDRDARRRRETPSRNRPRRQREPGGRLHDPDEILPDER